jgi:hypothetical protein
VRINQYVRVNRLQRANHCSHLTLPSLGVVAGRRLSHRHCVGVGAASRRVSLIALTLQQQHLIRQCRHALAL